MRAENSTGPNNKYDVIFIVLFKFYIKSAGGDDKFVVINKFWAFWCIICLCSCWEQKGHQKNIEGKPWQMYDVIVQLSYSFILIEMNDLFDFSHQGQNYSALWASEEN